MEVLQSGSEHCSLFLFSACDASKPIVVSNFVENLWVFGEKNVLTVFVSVL